VRVDASHVEQVRAILAAIPELPEITQRPYLRAQIERMIGEAMGLVEGEWEACELFARQVLEERSDIGSQVPADDDAVEV
jgi:hypothetical protein